jgi:ribosome maturation factor RimP
LEKESAKGTEAFPSSINMSNETQALTSMIEELLGDDPTVFLVHLTITPGNNIKIFLDGDQGVTIDKCVSLNRKLYKQLEENNYFNGDFSLEVSSAGVDEPLRLHRQYVKNIGRNVELKLNDGATFEGKLLAVNDDGIVVEEVPRSGGSKSKKKELVQHTFLFDQIKTTTIQVVF